jgi:hypothetical protein
MNNTKPAGRTHGHWVEYEETPFMHGKGYFWLRPDGLRFGYRVAGSYYRPGTTPEPVEAPFHPFEFLPDHPKYKSLAHLAPAGSYADGAVAFDVLGGMREDAKKESLPAHLRVMRDGKELELISKIDGVDLEVRLRDSSFDPFEFIDRRFPMPSPDRVVDAKVEGGAGPGPYAG